MVLQTVTVTSEPSLGINGPITVDLDSSSSTKDQAVRIGVTIYELKYSKFDPTPSPDPSDYSECVSGAEETTPNRFTIRAARDFVDSSWAGTEGREADAVHDGG
eukprot:EC720854.1.p1 GENE.EC720854.1~~EC720854.1.p1  ORF type:complete len:104 (+),score=2.44 EC720854.1:37-348(+)